jgi:hypothetical protein
MELNLICNTYKMQESFSHRAMGMGYKDERKWCIRKELPIISLVASTIKTNCLNNVCLQIH